MEEDEEWREGGGEEGNAYSAMGNRVESDNRQKERDGGKRERKREKKGCIGTKHRHSD